MEPQHIDRKRKLDHEQDSAAVGLSLCEIFDQRSERVDGWDTLYPILENDILQAKIPSSEAALSHLVKWFRIIARDTEKLRVFRHWVVPSSGIVKQELAERVECTSSPVSSCIVSSSAQPSSSSLSSILNKNNSSTEMLHAAFSRSQSPDTTTSSSTGSFTTESNTSIKNNGTQHALLQQLVQQQQQALLLQQLQKQSPSKQQSGAAQVTTIGIFPRMGSSSSLLTVTIKGGHWHARSPQCECVLGFTGANGSTTIAQRIPGGAEGDMLFIVPHFNCSPSSPTSASIPMVVHLTPCTAPQERIVSLEQFLYTPRERSLGSSVSDEDSEEMCEEATSVDGDEDEGSPPPQALPPLDIPNTACPTPKQMMTIRERMMEYIQQRNSNRASAPAARLTVLQQPTVRVVWKNRRLDVPFKLKVECSDDSASNGNAFNVLTPSKLFLLAVVADHKGRLQIDAAENFAEDFSSQGVAHFSNLRMTKGTWGKEWTITFAAVVKASLNNPIIAGMSAPCPIVVKTRKNPQVRHNTGSRAQSVSPPHAPLVERKNDDTPVRAKRHRVEDLLDRAPSPLPRTTSHSEDMASLLAAAELKQQEQTLQEGGQDEPTDIPCLPLMVKQSEADTPFASFQNLMNYLEEVRSKRQISLGMVDQPQPKRDSKVLIVKKGKPFRVPFQVQLRSTAVRHNPQHYVCVAVVRNDKGEEVAVRNCEVPFDWRGIACFAGLMVMKGTWGKTVQLTFEARWAAKGRGVAELPPSWTTQRMLVVSETAPTQLMCYTKDKKPPGSS